MNDLRWRLADDTPQGALFDGFRDGDEVLERRPGTGRFAGMEFLHVRARRIINEVRSPGPLPFRFTINAYRGCSHACTYCFARPTHAYLGLDTASDFDRRIVVKVNAAERLEAELRDRRWRGDAIAMGTNTDPYQRCEGKYRLTRSVIEVLGAAGNPFSILTKSPLVLRDLDVLTTAAQRADVRCALSIGTLDEDVWRTSEPGTPHPRRRVEAVARLNEAGIPCGVLVAPVLPGLSDRPEQLADVVDACVAAGATSIGSAVLHLRPGVREVFLPWLERTYPHLVERYAELYPAATAPRSTRREVARVVGDRLAWSGRRSGTGGGRRAPRAADAAPDARPTEQLGFGL